ncbi:MAG: ADP-ribosylglycohydrolase family protein [Luteolibacter sp.]|uniref:ADP-ribosylglycohydrolase family protein n=1 Tax=Luteolibacter sp. TaxID=1962973 RepID=UPI00326576DE
MNLRLTHSLLGTALGDSLGLPSEGMSRVRIARRWKGPLEQRFLFGHGMLSDDTEHTILASQALLSCGGDPKAFQKRLAAKLKWWFAGLPAGIGLATAKAIIKLWIGFPPGGNGVCSAGNGPVMRAPILGVYFANDSQRRATFVEASTRLTHTDRKAVEAAMMAADCAAFAANGELRMDVILTCMKELGVSEVWDHPIEEIEKALAEESSVRQFADGMGFSKGVAGYAVHTMTMVLFIWLRHRGDFVTIVSEAIACGGDTDSVAAIAGGIAGAETEAFNPQWLCRLSDRPYTVNYISRLGAALGESGGGCHVKAPSVANYLIIPRNILFFIAVLFHGFRRIFPPY